MVPRRDPGGAGLGTLRATGARRGEGRGVPERVVGGPALPGDRDRDARPGLGGGDPPRSASTRRCGTRGSRSPSSRTSCLRTERSAIEGRLPRLPRVPAGSPRSRDSTRRRDSGCSRDYVDVAMLRDVMERHGVSNVVGPALAGPAPARQRGGDVQRGEVLRGAQVSGTEHLQGHGPRAPRAPRGLLPRPHGVDRDATSERRRMVNPAQGVPGRSRAHPGVRPHGPGQRGPRPGDPDPRGAGTTRGGT